MESFVTSKKEEIISAVESFLASLPADTKSVQLCCYAFNSSYDDYNDKTTKTVKEDDFWWNLSPDDQIGLLASAVTETLKQTVAFIGLPSDSEDALLARKTEEQQLVKAYKRLSRSFTTVLGNTSQDNLETAAVAEDQLENLFKGVISFQNKEVYTLLQNAFASRAELASALDQIQWKLLSTGSSKSDNDVVRRPIAVYNANRESSDDDDDA